MQETEHNNEMLATANEDQFCPRQVDVFISNDRTKMQLSVCLRN